MKIKRFLHDLIGFIFNFTLVAGLPTFILFLIFKICNVIQWNWILVFIPFIVLLLSAIFLIFYGDKED